MLEVSLLSTSCKKNIHDTDEKTEITYSIATIIAVLVYITILVWALKRAMLCSSATPDSRALHFMFCFMSPTLYLASSYLIPGFCPE